MMRLRLAFLAALLPVLAHAQMPVTDLSDRGYEPQAHSVEVKDPWQGYNRGMHKFNVFVDDKFTKPIAKGYNKAVPKPLRTGIRNFFVNLFQPLSAVHLLLQGRPGAAGAALGRFAMNATLGLGGLFDPATDAGIPLCREDLGQTLGVWGWKHSRYFELPFLGPSTLRDALGFTGDFPVSPFAYVDTPERYYALSLYIVDLRAGALAGEKLVRGGGDDYTLVRDAYLQARDFQINDRSARNTLPDYLLDEEAAEGEE